MMIGKKLKFLLVIITGMCGTRAADDMSDSLAALLLSGCSLWCGIQACKQGRQVFLHVKALRQKDPKAKASDLAASAFRSCHAGSILPLVHQALAEPDLEKATREERAIALAKHTTLMTAAGIGALVTGSLAYRKF